MKLKNDCLNSNCKELQKEFNGLDRFDEDIPRANNVIDVSEPSDERIKDIEGKVDKNQFGTIELHAGSPRKLLDISKLKNLGWKHKINLESGIKKTYEWFLFNQNNFKN